MADDQLERLRRAAGLAAPPAPPTPMQGAPTVGQAQQLDRLKSALLRSGAPVPTQPLAPTNTPPTVVSPGDEPIDVSQAASQLDLSKPFGSPYPPGFLPPAPRSPVISPEQMRSFPDPFKELSDNLFLSRGLELNVYDFDQNDYHLWARKYQGFYEQDAVFRKSIEALWADPEKKHIPAASMAVGTRLLYTLQKAAPTPQEELQSMRDALWDWSRARFRTSATTAGLLATPLGGPGSYPEDIRPANPNVAPPSDATANAYLNMFKKFEQFKAEAHTLDDIFTAEEKQLLDPLGGFRMGAVPFFQFYRPRQEYYLSRHRIEKFVGLPINRGPDEAPTIDDPARLPPEGGVLTTIPTEPNWPLTYIAPVVPEIGEFAQVLSTAGLEAQKNLVEERKKSYEDWLTFAERDPEYAWNRGMGRYNDLPGVEPWIRGKLERYYDQRAGATFQEVNGVRLPKVYPNIPLPTIPPEQLPPSDQEENARALYRIASTTPILLNLATIGMWEAARRGIHYAGENVAKLVWNDPRAFEAYINRIPANVYARLMAGFDPRGSDFAAAYDEFWRGMFPVTDPIADSLSSSDRINVGRSTELALQRLSTGPGTFAHVLGLDSPHTQAALGQIATGLFQDGASVFLNLAGLHTLYRAVRGWPKLKEMPTPVKNLSFLDQMLAADGTFSPAPAQARAPLLSAFVQQLSKVKDTATARGIVARTQAAAEIVGALNTPLTAGAVRALDKASTILSSLNGRKLTRAGKQAIVELADPIYELGPTDAWWSLTGKIEPISPRESARVARDLSRWMQQMEQSPSLPTPEAIKFYFEPGKRGARIQDYVQALTERTQIISTAQRNRHLARNIVADTLPFLEEAKSLKEKQIKITEDQRQMFTASHNAHMEELFTKWRDLELNGGWRPVPNPSQTSAMYTDLLNLKSGGVYTIPNLLADQKRWSMVMGTDGPTAKSLLKSGRMMDKALANKLIMQRVNDWLHDHSKPGLVKVDPNPKPREGFISSFQKRIDEVKADPGQLLDLNEAEAAILNEHRLRSAWIKPGYGTKVMNAVTRDLEAHRVGLEEYTNQINQLNAFSEYLNKLDPLDPNLAKGVQIDKKLLGFMDQLFGSDAWRLQDKGYVRVSPHATPETMDTLKAWNSARGLLEEEARLLDQGLYTYSAVDAAIANIVDPRRATYFLQRQRRIAEDMTNYFYWDFERTQKLLDRKLTPKEYQDLLIAAKDATTINPEAQLLNQKHRMLLLQKAYAAGVVPLNKYLDWSGNIHYYHGVYEKPDGKVSPYPTFRKPSRLTELEMSPEMFKFKAPEKTWYVAYETPGGGHTFKDGFADKAAAEAWLEKADLPEGTKVAINPPFLFTEKEMAGLIVHQGLATSDLTEKFAYTVQAAMNDRAISESPFFTRYPEASREPKFTQTPEGGWKDIYGTEWWPVNNPDTPWLNGGWIHPWAVEWLHHFNRQTGWYKALSDAQSLVLDNSGFGGVGRFIADIPKRYALWKGRTKGSAWDTFMSRKSNPILTTGSMVADMVFGRHVSTGTIWQMTNAMSNLVGANKVAFSPWMPATQFSSNALINMPAAGFNIFTPLGFVKFLRYSIEGLDTLHSGAPDALWDNMAMVGHKTSSKIAFDRYQRKMMRDSYHSIEGYAASIERRAREISDYQATGAPDANHLARLILDKQNLEQKLEQVAQIEAGKLFGGTTGRWVNDLWPNLVGLVTGREKYSEKGKQLSSTGLSDFAFSFVGLPDLICKYAVYRHLIEDRGMSFQEAFPYVDKFMQNLDRVPESVKGLSGYLGGSKFTMYPFNMMQVAGNMLQHRKYWLLKYMLGIAGFNYAMILGNQQNPEEVLDRYASNAGFGRRSFTSDLSYFLGRINLPGPGNRAISMDPVWGWILPRSPISRRINNAIWKSPQLPNSPIWDQILRSAETLALGAASKFIGGSPAASFLEQTAAARDARGQPINTFGDWMNTFGQTVLPDWTPGIGRDAEEFYSWLTTNYRNPSTGLKKSITEYWARRAIGLIPADTLSDQAVLRAQIDYVVAEAGNAEQITSIRTDQTYKYYMYQHGKIKPDGNIDTKDPGNLELTRKWIEDNPQYIPLPDGGHFAKSRNPKEMLEKGGAPNTIARLRYLTLAQKIAAYTQWRMIVSTPDPDLHRQILKIINSGADNSSEVETLNDMKHLVPVLLNDDRIPEDARLNLKRWFDKTIQNKVRHDLNRNPRQELRSQLKKAQE